MGQKVNPIGFRLGQTQYWRSKWYTSRDYWKSLLEDHKLRQKINELLPNAGVADILIERHGADRLRITVNSSRPGMIIGRRGKGIDDLRAELEKLAKKRVNLTVTEIRDPDLNAKLVADSIASSIQRRVSFRRAMRQAMQRTMRRGAKGIRVRVAGRLGGAEIARDESAKEGSVPLSTLRADIDYAVGVAHTTYGPIGVKVWIYKGDLPSEKEQRKLAKLRAEREQEAARKAAEEAKEQAEEGAIAEGELQEGLIISSAPEEAAGETSEAEGAEGQAPETETPEESEE